MSWARMKKTPRRLLIETAGRLHALEEELAALKKQRAQLEDRIQAQERKLAAAASAFDTVYARAGGGRASAVADAERGGEDPVTPGKLPHRVLERIKRDPTKIYTAADLATELTIRDVQQVRTALARLVSKGLIRRAGTKGEFTI